MAIAYTKTTVGTKLFTVEWDLHPDAPDQDIGAVFEATDGELVSVFAFTGAGDGINNVLHVSNWATGPNDQIAASIEINGELILSAPPKARWYWPQAFGSNPLCKVALLFREI